ncbi:DUF417 family protein [Carboxylicivirga linearis]|uniref:DUF417 family protein n=1 Tax=Carboxylicivirga linearis TaxID=1628157 RepID=A0ABS5JWG9_9BACT|nr:DUF417 family protein [Carboxylicivirga linearis]MBS2098821.1 DUF417 family protein [Carboxylicivirga linearis]
MILAKSFKAIGQFIFRYGLALIFIWLGILKFKNSEADYLKDILQNSSMFSWMLKYVTSYTFSLIIAYLQIGIGILLAIKPVAKKLSLVGGLLAVLVLGISVLTLFTSGYVWQTGYGFPELSKVGQSILKDLLLFGAAAWCVGDSL